MNFIDNNFFEYLLDKLLNSLISENINKISFLDYNKKLCNYCNIDYEDLLEVQKIIIQGR